jgi:large subunit ribosomal protein L10
MKTVVENIPQIKINIVKELVDLLKAKRTVLIADIGNIPGSQFQQISKKLRGKALVKVPKKNLFERAIDDFGKKELIGLKEKFFGASALLFSDLDSFELSAELLDKKSPAKAKPGQTAPTDLEIPAGPTDLTPGPAISELGALGIQIMIQGGKIEIKEPRVVAKEGEAISQGAADMLSKLNILPFSIGFNPVCAYDAEDNKLYLEIKIDKEETLEALKYAYARALPFAGNIGYITTDTVKFMVQKAGSQEKRLIKVISGEVDDVENDTPTLSGVPSEEGKESEKEEPKVDAGAGLASLFG